LIEVTETPFLICPENFESEANRKVIIRYIKQDNKKKRNI
jgi:hypothetical protein